MRADCLLFTLAAVIALINGCSCFSGFFFNIAPTDVVAERQQTLHWECSAQGEEPILYTWYQEGVAINDSAREVLNNGTLVIHGVTYRRDRENYRCCATNPVGVLCGASVRLSIATLPQFSINPESTNVTEGATARLACYTEGNPPPVILWKRDRRIIDMTGSNNPRYNMLPGGILQIDNVQPADAGEYKCQASNILRMRNSSPAVLTVLPPFDGPLPQVPEIVAAPQNLVRAVGDFAIFECLASHPEYTIRWSRQGNEPIRTEGVGNIGRRNLFIASVTLADAGVYICTVTNTDTALSVFSQARLSVHEPPRISRTQLKDVQITVGSIGRFMCRVTGTPLPKVTWLHEGRVIQQRDRTSIQANNDLVINGIRPEDAGIYQCTAVNVAGNDIASALLQPTEVVNEPDSPRNLRVNYTTSTSIELAWDPPGRTAIIVAYSIHYQEIGGNESPIPVSRTKVTCLLDDLTPFTTYEIYARTWMKMGPSAPSNTIIVKTPEDVPSIAPDFFASSSSQTSINIVWSEIEGPARNGIIVSYVIEYEKVDQSPSSREAPAVISVAADQTSYELADLDPNTEHKLRMAAATSVGAGDYSSWVNVRTLDDSIDTSLPPPTVDVRALNHTAIQISIGPIEGDAEGILGFNVAILDEEGSNVKDLMIPLDNLVFAVNDLSPSTTYEVHVKAYTADVEGLTASGTVVTHAPPICSNGFPPKFNLTSTSPRSILVTWEPSLTDLPVQAYTIRYSTILSNMTMKEVTYKTRKGDSPIYQLRVGELEPYTDYQVEIRVHIPNCNGRFGSSRYIKTLQDVPSSVARVLADPLDPYSIRLTWQSPKEPNGVITHYVITYNDDPISPAEAWTRVQQNGSNEFSVVRNLRSNTAYYFKVQAGTQVGEGPPTAPVMAKTPEDTPGAPDQQMGILIGVIMALMCIVICCTILLIRFRNPNRGKGNVSVVSAKEHLAQGGYLCNGRCRMRERTSFPESLYIDDPETIRPMLSDGHIMPPQGIVYHHIGTYPGTETLQQPDSDLSNHSASSGFADSSSQAGEHPITTPQGSPHPHHSGEADIHLHNLSPVPDLSSQGNDAAGREDTLVLEPVPNGRGAVGGHVRYVDPLARETEHEVPLLEKMMRSTMPGETQV